MTAQKTLLKPQLGLRQFAN